MRVCVSWGEKKRERERQHSVKNVEQETSLSLKKPAGCFHRALSSQ